ncbi:hypothetical protein WR25_00944 [Diploscapter pachys]|uniref:ACB domain-containing protein n=1 Tax=Diploscapter pachys TaxID=2018661 RepID=A0A2A2LII3_9BILA|nr:hypothetical protein WR25_00944 [Diploscapter pachys]
MSSGGQQQGPSIEEQFKAAVDIVHSLPKEGPITTSTGEKLQFYSLYKQATEGPCNIPQPAFYRVIERTKWNEWNALGEMTMDEAKHRYVETIKRKIEDVRSKYPTEEWLGDQEMRAKIEHKFAILGITDELERQKEKDKDSSEEHDGFTEITDPNTNGSSTDETLNGDIEQRALDTPATNRTGTEEHEITDSEYKDAEETNAHTLVSSRTRHRTSSNEGETSKRRRNGIDSQSLRASCHRLELELRAISEKIDVLTKAVETRHNVLISLFKKAANSLSVYPERSDMAKCSILPALAILRSFHSKIL